MKPFVLFFVIAMCLPSFTKGAEETDYLRCIDKSLYAGEASVRMEIFKNGRMLKYYDLQFYRLDDNIRMEFTDPAPERGRRMLNDNSNFWMYMPRTGKVMKLPLKQSFMGSDASNRDLMKISFEKDYDLVKVTLQDASVMLLELKAKDLAVSYNKVLVTYDAEKKAPLKQQMFSLSGKLIKTILYEDLVKMDGQYIPAVLKIRDELQKNTQTVMHYKNVKRKGNKPAEFFTLGSLKR